MTTTCNHCGSPDRKLWSYARIPPLRSTVVGNWIELRTCPECGQLWCSVSHEPHASYEFLTAWPYDEAVFRRLNEIDRARPLHEWHDAVLREEWSKLPADEIEAIEAWRDRTYRHFNPIDRGPHMSARKYVHQTADLAEIVRQSAR